MSTFTRAQIYVLPVITLVVAIAAFVIAFLAKYDVSETNLPKSVVTKIRNSNGFAATVVDNEATFTTTTKGLLKGDTLGALISASEKDVTSFLLTDFLQNPLGTISTEDSILTAFGKCAVLNQTPLTEFVQNPSGLIVSSDSVLSAIEKCAVLKQTPLTGFVATPTGIISSIDTIFSALQKVVVLTQTPLGSFTAAAGTITGNDNILTSMQKIQGNVNFGNFVFSVYGAKSTSSTSPFNLYDPTKSTPIGAPIIRSVIWKPGTSLIIKNFCSATIIVAGTITMTQNLIQFLAPGVASLTTPSLGVGTWSILFETTLCYEDNFVHIYATMTAANAANIGQIWQGLSTSNVFVDSSPSGKYTVDLSGSVSNASNTLIFNNAVCTVAFTS
jgi:hypothetical protein